MSIPRFYCDSISDDVVILSGTEAHHLSHVRRLNVGDIVEVFDGRGKICTAAISEISKQNAKLAIKQTQQFSPEQTNRIVIAAAIAKGSRFDWLVGKCSELGIDRIIPVIFARTVKLSAGTQTVDRLKKLAIESSKQCQRLFLH